MSKKKETLESKIILDVKEINRSEFERILLRNIKSYMRNIRALNNNYIEKKRKIETKIETLYDIYQESREYLSTHRIKYYVEEKSGIITYIPIERTIGFDTDKK